MPVVDIEYWKSSFIAILGIDVDYTTRSRQPCLYHIKYEEQTNERALTEHKERRIEGETNQE